MIALRPSIAGFCLGLAVLLGAGAPARDKAKAKETPDGPKAGGNRYALLVGVTDYPHLDRRDWLEGGANDVLLMKALLTEKYRFPEKNITILSEADSKRLPTRQNIEAQCQRLAGLVNKGDQVVVLLSGHGSRQPDLKEPNGFKGLFLPSDTKVWDKDQGAVVNAISGPELGKWLRPLVKKEALLWVVVDACHSGEMVRGRHEKTRELDMHKSLKIPLAQIEQAMEKVRKSLATLTFVSFPNPLETEPGVVCTYACLSRQLTVEGRYEHPETKQRIPCGLLTHTLTNILRASDAPITYRELMQRIQNAYTADSRDWPSPVIVGTLQDNVVLGKAKLRRPGFFLTKRKDGKLSVNAGVLHGLTKGTILGVYPKPGVKGDLMGHVRITLVTPIRAEVIPIAAKGTPTPKETDIVGGRCKVVEVVYEDLRLRVAVDRLGSVGEKADLERLDKEIQSLAGHENAAIAHVPSQDQAQWLARLEKGKVYLLPRRAWVDERQRVSSGGLGPPPPETNLSDWLKDSFAKVVRAEKLLQLAATDRTRDEWGEEDNESADFRPRVKVEIVRRFAPRPKKDAPASIAMFYHGDQVRFQMRNTSKVPIDVTVLYVESKFGITPLFPTVQGNEFNRIEPGKTIFPTTPIDVKGTLGRENIVVVAVKSDPEELTDFVALGQESIKEAQKVAKTRGKKSIRGLDSPLGLLLQKAMYGERKTRQMTPAQVQEFSTEVIPVRVLAGKRPAEAK